MIISEIIEHLERLKSYHGDVELFMFDGACNVCEVNMCDFVAYENVNYISIGRVEKRHILLSM